MATIPPSVSEIERRLLREYRLTAVPSRRSSCSPATSNASSSTNTNLSEHSLELPHLTTADNFRFQGAIPGCEYYDIISPNQRNSIEDNRFKQQQQNSRSKRVHGRVKGSPIISPKGARQSAGHFKAKQRVITHTQELSPDELNRILDIVSQLSYLKLVSSRDFASSAIKQDSVGVVELDRLVEERSKPAQETRIDASIQMRNYINDGLKGETQYDNSANRDNYIFEKVNYIKRMKQRKKALKELRKAKSRSKKSPRRISGCSKTQTKCDQ